MATANAKKLAELGISAEEPRGGMAAALLKKAIEAGAHRNQFHPSSPGQSGDWFMSPTGRLVTQFQPLSHSAWRPGQEDILEPLFGPEGWPKAIETGDYSLQRLGAARAGRRLLAGIPTSIGTGSAQVRHWAPRVRPGQRRRQLRLDPLRLARSGRG